MPRRGLISIGLLAFGAGLTVGAKWPRPSRFAGLIMERLGFRLDDVAMLMWEPEETPPEDIPARRRKSPAKRKRKTTARRKNEKSLTSPGSRVIKATLN